MIPVATHFSDTARPYRGPELRSHFARDTFGVEGDSIVAFVGPCDVPVENLVDLEDVRANAPIFSPRMLHFLVERMHLFGSREEDAGEGELAVAAETD